MVEPAILGPLDLILAPVVEYVILVVVLANLLTRLVAHRRHRAQAAEGAESVSRYRPHEATNVLLVLVSFYFLTINHHSGIVLSTLVVGTVLADFFEFEARRVEARQELPIEAPKGAIVASAVVFLYAAYLSLFFLIEPLWSQLV